MTYLCGSRRCHRYSPCKCRGSHSKECSNGKGFHCSGKVLLEFKRELKLVLSLRWGWLLYLDFVFYGVCCIPEGLGIGLNYQLNNRVNELTELLTLVSDVNHTMIEPVIWFNRTSKSDHYPVVSPTGSRLKSMTW
jgi:hypothetical protein